MIEIAIAIGVIGFALVAIIGILPAGLNVQKDAHTDTIINQDGTFFMEAIRSGAPANGFGTNSSLDFLTNSVEAITIQTNNTTNGPTYTAFTSGQQILGLLSTPQYPIYGLPPPQRNLITARVRALSGNALELNGASTNVAFRYLMQVEIMPALNINPAENGAPQVSLNNNLFDIHLRFTWPVVVAGGNVVNVGNMHQNFRSQVSGSEFEVPANVLGIPQSWWFFQPNTYNNQTK
jgi:hypothetical protein